MAAFLIPTSALSTRRQETRRSAPRSAPLRPPRVRQRRKSNLQPPLTLLPLAPSPTTTVPLPSRTTRPVTPTTSPAPPAPSINPPNTRPKRKPHGYWNSLSNLENELQQVNHSLNHPPRTMPSIADLRRLHRTDIVAALSKHGGLKRVAETLRWHRASSTHPRQPTRQRLRRRPNHYWDSCERVMIEIQAFIDEFGTRGHMPTRAQFYQVGRSDLVNAAARHGGLGILAGKMGLVTRKTRKQWSDFEAVEEAMRRFSDEGKMPTAKQLHDAGEGGLVHAIVSNGGFREVAKRLGLRCRGRSGQGAPNVWDEKRLKKEVLAFVMAQFPSLARRGVMPSERMVRSCGRADISYAIGKFGGFRKVATMVGLTTRRASAGKVNDLKDGKGKTAHRDA